MARQMTRGERIEYEMCLRRRGYCEAFVDGMIAVENAGSIFSTTQIDIVDKGCVRVMRHGKLVYED